MIVGLDVSREDPVVREEEVGEATEAMVSALARRIGRWAEWTKRCMSARLPRSEMRPLERWKRRSALVAERRVIFVCGQV